MLERHQADAITIECLFLKHRKPSLSFALKIEVEPSQVVSVEQGDVADYQITLINDRGVSVEQTTRFPEEEGTTLLVHAKKPAAFTLSIAFR